MSRQIIQTVNAPQAIGTYSQAVRVGSAVYISGQIPLDPQTGILITDDINLEIRRVFDNLAAIAMAAGSSLAQSVRVTIYLLDMTHFSKVNDIMADYFPKPWPARAAVAVAELPRGARIEIDCILHLE